MCSIRASSIVAACFVCAYICMLYARVHYHVYIYTLATTSLPLRDAIVIVPFRVPHEPRCFTFAKDPFLSIGRASSYVRFCAPSTTHHSLHLTQLDTVFRTVCKHHHYFTAVDLSCMARLPCLLHEWGHQQRHIRLTDRHWVSILGPRSACYQK